MVSAHVEEKRKDWNELEEKLNVELNKIGERTTCVSVYSSSYYREPYLGRKVAPCNCDDLKALIRSKMKRVSYHIADNDLFVEKDRIVYSTNGTKKTLSIANRNTGGIAYYTGEKIYASIQN